MFSSSSTSHMTPTPPRHPPAPPPPPHPPPQPAPPPQPQPHPQSLYQPQPQSHSDKLSLLYPPDSSTPQGPHGQYGLSLLSPLLTHSSHHHISPFHSSLSPAPPLPLPFYPSPSPSPLNGAVSVGALMSPSPSLSAASSTSTSTMSNTSPGLVHFFSTPSPQPLHDSFNTPYHDLISSPQRSSFVTPQPHNHLHPHHLLPHHPAIPVARRMSPPQPTIRSLLTAPATTRSAPVTTSDAVLPVLHPMHSLLSNSATLSSNAPAISPSSCMSASTNSSPSSISSLYSSSPDTHTVGARFTMPTTHVTDPFPPVGLITSTVPSSASPASLPPMFPAPFPRPSATSAFSALTDWPSPFLSAKSGKRKLGDTQVSDSSSPSSDSDNSTDSTCREKPTRSTSSSTSSEEQILVKKRKLDINAGTSKFASSTSSDEDQTKHRQEARQERRQHLAMRDNNTNDNIITTTTATSTASELLKGRVRTELAAQHAAHAHAHAQAQAQAHAQAQQQKHSMDTATTGPTTSTATQHHPHPTTDKPRRDPSSEGSGSGWESSDVTPTTDPINPAIQNKEDAQNQARAIKRQQMKQQLKEMSAALAASQAQHAAAMEQVHFLQQLIVRCIQNGSMLVPMLQHTQQQQQQQQHQPTQLTPPNFPSLQHNPYAPPQSHTIPIQIPALPAAASRYPSSSAPLVPTPSSLGSNSSSTPTPPSSLSPSSSSSGSTHPPSFLSPRVAFTLYHISQHIHDHLIHEIECIENETDRVLFWNSFLLFLIPGCLVQYLMQSRTTCLSWLHKFSQCFLTIHTQLGSASIPSCASVAEQLAMHCILVEAGNTQQTNKIHSLAAYTALPTSPLDHAYLTVRDHLMDITCIQQLYALNSNMFIGKKQQLAHPLHPESLFDRVPRLESERVL